MSRSKPVYRRSVGINAEVDFALQSFGGSDVQKAAMRRWAIHAAVREGVLAITERLDRTGGVPLLFRFEIVDGDGRFVAAMKERQQIDTVLEAATKAAESE